MQGEDIVKMSKKELGRIGLIRKVIDRVIKQEEAGRLLGLTSRQIRRIVKRVKKEGDVGIIHKNRGKESNRKIEGKIQRKVMKLYEKKYWDFGPTLASEKLQEREGIEISDETLRKWLIEEGLWVKGRKVRAHRQWRERKASFGEMVQIDGSHHDWLEGRGERLVLMGYIDDATGKAYGRFYDYEGTLPALDSFLRYTKKNGIVQTVYVDRHTTYKSPKKNVWEDALTLSQFEQALGRLGVRVIHAGSPQAKGRIERLFRTFQDRLVKDLRLAKIKTKDRANEFLEGYLPRFNDRFEKEPKSKANLHREVSEGMVLEKELSIQESRVLRNDNTIRYEGKFYQIQRGWTRRPKAVLLEQRVDGSLHIRDGAQELGYHQIHEPMKKVIEPKVRGYLHKGHIPSQDHPWRRTNEWVNAYWPKETKNVQDTTHLNEPGREISSEQGLRSKPDSTLSTYSHNSQREKKEAKKRERTAAIFLIQKNKQNQKEDISILAERGHF